MGAQVDIVAAIFVVQDLAITGHQHGDGIREQEHARGHRSGHAIQAFVPNADVFEFDSVHQVMQGHVSVAAAQPSEQRRHEAGERHHRIAPECAEQQIEPDDIGLEPVQGLQQSIEAAGIIERPAAQNGKAIWFDMVRREFVGQNRQAEEWIAF